MSPYIALTFLVIALRIEKYKRHWFLIEPGSTNPYKLVYRVVSQVIVCRHGILCKFCSEYNRVHGMALHFKLVTKMVIDNLRVIESCMFLHMQQ